jgi:DNA-binding response OmpR family regulator
MATQMSVMDLEDGMRVTVAEDDIALSMFLKKGLETDGHTVCLIADGAAALTHVVEESPDLLLLDLGLPRLDGVDVLRTLENSGSSTSLLVLTGRTHLAQKIECLNLGADDYLIKPFSLHELLARCRAVGRRRVSSQTGMLRHGQLRMDRIGRSVRVGGTAIEFTTKEFALLEYLLLQRGRPVTRGELLELVWHMPADAATNVVDVYVNYLRRKLATVESAELVETVRGEGYTIGLDRKPVRSEMEIHPVTLGGDMSRIPRVGAA